MADQQVTKVCVKCHGGYDVNDMTQVPGQTQKNPDGTSNGVALQPGQGDYECAEGKGCKAAKE